MGFKKREKKRSFSNSSEDISAEGTLISVLALFHYGVKLDNDTGIQGYKDI